MEENDVLLACSKQIKSDAEEGQTSELEYPRNMVEQFGRVTQLSF